MQGRITKIQKLSGKFHNIFRFTRRTAKVKLHNGKEYSLIRHVLETGPAVSVLPYFYDEQKKIWNVVMVRQYRPAVDAVCLEAPGGLTHEGSDLKREMARELQEESGIKITPRAIKVIGSQHLANSFCDQVVHLGIVKLPPKIIDQLRRKEKIHNGVISEREFTEVIVLPLAKVLNNQKLVTYTLAKYQALDLKHRLGDLLEG